MIPYGCQTIDEDDITAVSQVLRSDFLTTGPVVDTFEAAVSERTDSHYGVVFSSGTAALHGMMAVLGIGPGDEVITSPMTFAATANAILYVGAVPVFADVDPDTLLLDVADVATKINTRTRAVIAVDYAGTPCDYDALRALTNEKGLVLLSDACHSLGAEYCGRKVGSLADMTAFSFHPVKPLTTGEGGMVVTNDQRYAEALRRFRNHGISVDYKVRDEKGTWFYEIDQLGYNYRLSDIQCALGISQLKKLEAWVERRRDIAQHYDRAFSQLEHVRSLVVPQGAKSAHHLYVVKVGQGGRGALFERLKSAGIGVNVHYIPVYYHPVYRRLGYARGACPVAESVYDEILSLPIYPRLSVEEQDFVIAQVNDACVL